MGKPLCFRAVVSVFAALLVWGASTPGVRADEAEGHYRMGLNHKRKGEIPQAINAVKAALKLRPDHAAAHMTLGGLYADQGLYAEALASYDRVMKLSPQHAQAYAMSGAVLIRLKHYPAAAA
jgi:tetratricopeptide (TPR) repeat protein